jgi:phosphoribosylaminoimidazole (AIR) synthetase
MRRTFNMGIGMITIVSPEDASYVQHAFEQRGQAVYRIGVLREKTSNKDKISFI